MAFRQKRFNCGCVAAVLLVVVFVGLYLAAREAARQFVADTGGKEFPLGDASRALASIARKEFSMPDFVLTADHAWVEGWQDHLYLIRARCSVEMFAQLKDASQKRIRVPGESLELSVDTSGCPVRIPQKPPNEGSVYQMPWWWHPPEKASVLYWTDHRGGYWFAFDAESNLLWVCIFDF